MTPYKIGWRKHRGSSDPHSTARDAALFRQMIKDGPWRRVVAPCDLPAVERGVACCSMCWRTTEMGAPPHEAAK